MSTRSAARVDIRQVGRWTYQLALYPPGRLSDLVGFEGPRVIGRRRALRKARRWLRRMERDEAWRAPVASVQGEVFR